MAAVTSFLPAITQPTATASATGTATSTTGVANKTIADNFQTFLTLLTTQLKNQNPLDPLDTNQFTQQLVQFAQVEQQLKSNDQLATLVSLQKTAQATAALGFVGQTVGVDGNGQVTSRLLVERAETLDVLRRDAGELERALQQAGLKTADNGLQFALRDQGFAGRNDNGMPANTARLIVPDLDFAPAEIAQEYGRALRLGGGIDIRV